LRIQASTIEWAGEEEKKIRMYGANGIEEDQQKVRGRKEGRRVEKPTELGTKLWEQDWNNWTLALLSGYQMS
jgi:hypothetical protein